MMSGSEMNVEDWDIEKNKKVKKKKNSDTVNEMGQLKSKAKYKGKKKSKHNNYSQNESDNMFLCGVVEGFYGRPWTTDQRLELFHRMKLMGLNTYLYGPKDDYKHRLFWREKYTEEEADLLKKLIEQSHSQNVMFVYAISPGLDMTYTSEKEINALKCKLQQVKDLGCTAFALLFDDIDPVLRPADLEKYESSAHAQAGITNKMFEKLEKPKFIFCPTEYCGTMANPNVESSQYLLTLGKELHPEISVMWTGPKVVSNIITVDSIKRLNKVLKRKTMVWDNLHANDYDPKRVFFGPYKGRSTELKPYLNGVLTNPNCEFESNFVALHTLSTWWKSTDNKKQKVEKMESSEEIRQNSSSTNSDDDSDYSSHESHSLSQSTSNFVHGNYCPNEAFSKALHDWLPVFNQPRHIETKFVPRSGSISSLPSPLVSTQCALQSSVAPATCFATPIASSQVQHTSSSSNIMKEIECERNKLVEDSLKNKKVADDDVAMKDVMTSSVSSDSKEDDTKVMQIDTDHEISSQFTVDFTMQTDDNLQVNNDDDDNISIETPATNDSVTGRCLDNAASNDVVMEALMDSGPSTPQQPVSHNDEDYEPVTVNDLHVLAECFYLPYEHGKFGLDILDSFKRLKGEASSMSREKDRRSEAFVDKALQWTEKASEFDTNCQVIVDAFNRIIKCRNRALLYDIFPYISDMRGILSMLRTYVKWLGKASVSTVEEISDSSPHISAPVRQALKDKLMRKKQDGEDMSFPDLTKTTDWLSPDPEPWVFRGGLSGEIQRLLPVHSSFDLFCHVVPIEPQVNTYVVRPFVPDDESLLTEVCYSSLNDDLRKAFNNHKQLPGDLLLGAILQLSPEYTFVVEDENGDICGYLSACLDSKKFWTKYELCYLPEMKLKYPEVPEKDGKSVSSAVKKAIKLFYMEGSIFDSYGDEHLMAQYPSLLTLTIQPKSHHQNIVKNLMVCVLSALKSHNSNGVHVMINSSSSQNLDMYSKLGFTKSPQNYKISKDIYPAIPTDIESCSGDQKYTLLGRAF